MAYNVTNEFKEIIYSGVSDYDCRLYINNMLIPVEQIKTIKISSPIIDTTTDTGSMFHIGTFISNSIEITFRNLYGIDLTNNPNIYLEIGLLVNGRYEYVPIGYYLIDELNENYQKTCKVTCLDYAVKFKSELDISQFFNEDGKIYASDLFEAICGYYGVTVGTYPSINNDKEIYQYDNTLTGKQYIMYLAELFGGNAKIGRDGSCNIIPLKNYNGITINALTSKSFEVGDTYELTRVCYDNGIQKYEAGGKVISVDELPTENIDTNSYYFLTSDMKYYKYVHIEDEDNEIFEWRESQDIKNSLYLRTDNLFITQEYDVNQIYNAIVGFSVTNIKCENRIDISLDCSDIVKFTTDNGEYYTFYDNYINFNGTTMGKISVEIPLKLKQETTSIITNSTNSKISRINTILNEQAKTLEIKISEIDGTIGKVNSTLETVEGIKETISDLTGDIEDRFAEINTSINGINSKLTTTGGNNIFYYAKEFWSDGTINENNQPNSANLDEYTNSDIQQRAISGKGYLINAGTSIQTVNVPNGEYTISFNYRKLKPLATGFLYINGVQYYLDETNWTEMVIPITIDTQSIEFKIECSTDGTFEIYDLLGNLGSEKQVWTQNPNETRTETVTIGKGIRVDSDRNNTYTRIDADGTRIFNKDTNNTTTTFTDKGIDTEYIKSNKGEIGGLLIQTMERQIWFSSLL